MTLLMYNLISCASFDRDVYRDVANTTLHAVLVASAKYSTLPQHLGRSPVKSQLQAGVRLCSSGRVALRGGDWQTLNCGAQSKDKQRNKT